MMRAAFWRLVLCLADWLMELADAHLPPVPGGHPDYGRIQRQILYRLAADALDEEEAEREADCAARRAMLAEAAAITRYPLDD